MFCPADKGLLDGEEAFADDLDRAADIRIAEHEVKGRADSAPFIVFEWNDP